MIANTLSGGQLLGSLGSEQQSGAVSDLGATLTACQTQRGIAADEAAAPLNFATVLKSLTGYNPANYIGKTATGTDTKNATSTETDTPSLLDTIGQILGGVGSVGGSGNPVTGVQSLFNSLGGSTAGAGASGGTWFGG